MAKFLNTNDFNKWLLELIVTAKKELILIVPYIKISDNIDEALKKADYNNVNIVIIYRENKLSRNEKLNLLKLKNLNLLHHPNIHCKSYYNGELMIIGSMNLHSYSQNNNREMGAVFSINNFEYLNPDRYNDSEEDKDFINSSLAEFKEILNSSELEYQSTDAKRKEFKFDILKSDKEQSFEFTKLECNKINKVFKNKAFVPKCYNEKYYFSVCENYFDNVEVIFEGRRFAIKILKSDDYLESIYNLWMKTYDEFEFLGFKYYWNYHLSEITLYKDTHKYNWDHHLVNFECEIKKFKEGVDYIIKKYRQVKEEARIKQLVE